MQYPYFKKYYKLIAIDLTKQQKLDADPKVIQQINFAGNLDRAEGATMFFIIEKAKETVLDFSKGTVKSIMVLFNFNKIYKMTQYNTLNVKLSNSQLNKLISAIKKGTEVTLNLSSNFTGSYNDETNFPHNYY